MRRFSYFRIPLHIGYGYSKEYILKPDNDFHLGNLLFSHHGRVGRGLWWFMQVTLWLFGVITLWVYHEFGFHDAVFGAILTLVLFVIRLKLNIKRLHDRGKSGWWLLLFESPITVLIVGFVGFGFHWWLVVIPMLLGAWGFFEMGCRGSVEGETRYD